jgi:RNA polymerase sigma-70 factor, ECF subfamily
MSSAEYADAESVATRGPLDEESREWLRCLAGPAERELAEPTEREEREEREEALARLHQMLLRAARAELRRRTLPALIDGREQDDLAHQAADDALLAITSKLDRFRGESRFTTWAYKFVILEVSAKLGRHYWRNPPVPMRDDAWERIPDRFGVDPAEHAESRELVAALRRAVTEVLTERQRRVFAAIVVDGIPLDALAVELGSTRNALYKTMFDARRKIRADLVAHGYLDVEGGTL